MMMEEPKDGFLAEAVRTVRYLAGLRIPVYAAGAGYFMILSVFPLLILLLGLLRYTGLAVDTLTDLLEGVIPQALMNGAKRLILSTYRNTSGTVVSISALAALWSASRGIYGLIRGLNTVYHVPESRSWLRIRAVSMLYTFLFLLVVLLTLILSVFGTTLVRQLPVSPLLEVLDRVVDLRFAVLLVVQTALFTAMFMVLPNRKNTLRASLPGAVLASLGWLVFSDLYSIYVEHFTGYANVFGSVYAVALSMLWLYICLCIFFYGGAWNHFIRQKK